MPTISVATLRYPDVRNVKQVFVSNLIVLALFLSLAAPSAVAGVTVLLCEGTDVLAATNTGAKVQKYSISFDEDRKVLTVNGEAYDRKLRFQNDRIQGSNFSPLSSDSSIGVEYWISINRVTSDFTFSFFPATADGSDLSSDQIHRIVSVWPLFMIHGSCIKARAAF